MLDGVLRNPSLLVELEDENTTELLGLTLVSVSFPRARNEILDLIHWIFRSDSNAAVYATRSIAVLGLAACFPFHDKLLLPVCV